MSVSITRRDLDQSGFPIEGRRTYRRQWVDPGGQRSENVSSWLLRVLELSLTPHDTALFEIPPGFRPIAAQRPSVSQSIWTRLVNAWYWLWSLASR